MKNRIVKFRVWDKVEKTFWNTNDGLYFWLHGKTAKELGGISIAYFVGRNEQFVVQQFTGLTDENGKEIYEGDIIYEFERIRSFIEEKFDLGVVTYDNNRAAFVVNWGNIQGFYMPQSHQMEVRGNVFENTELLKKL